MILLKILIFFLIGNDQRLLKQLPLEALRNSPHKNLPLIKGITVPYTKLGGRLNSSVLERGLVLLNTIQNIPIDQITKNPERVTGFVDNYRMVDWSTQKIRIDVSRSA